MRAVVPRISQKGFICMNAVYFFLEIIGSLFALLLGRSLFLFFFEIIYFPVACALWHHLRCTRFWPGNDYQMVAIDLFVIYSIINTIQAVTTLGLILRRSFLLQDGMRQRHGLVPGCFSAASVRPQASRLFRVPSPRIRLCAPSRHGYTLACAYHVFKIEKGFGGDSAQGREEAVNRQGCRVKCLVDDGAYYVHVGRPWGTLP